MDAPSGQVMKSVAGWTGAALILFTAAAAGQDSGAGRPRGKLLYSTYCIGCHTTQVHWREKRLATDWASLKSQVRRWRENVGLPPDESDVVALAAYLNNFYYRFQVSGAKG